MPSPFDSLEVAARFTRQTGLPSWVVVKRQPAVVTRAQSLAERSGLQTVIEIDVATISVRFVVPQPRERVRRPARSRSVLRTGWARLARRAVAK